MGLSSERDGPIPLMDGLRRIQKDRQDNAGASDSLPRLADAGSSLPSAPAGPQLLSPGESSCPELWNRAQDLFNVACAERDNAEHKRKLMDAGLAFSQVVLAPGHFPIEKSFALNNIGLIMQAMDHIDKAEGCFAFALQMNPTHSTILNNYATTRMIKGDLKGANEWFYKALDKDPKCAEARWNSALISLTFGDFRRGFINYEYRWKCGTFTWRQLKTKRPQWNGQDLKGKTILLTHEQGLGDSIMFIRYAKMVKALGPVRVRYLCLPELICVLKDVEGIDSVTEFADINRDGTAGDEDFDYHCPLLSLPRIFKTRVDTVPWDGPYVKLRERVMRNTGLHSDNTETGGRIRQNTRIGIVWAGRKEHANDKNRSMKIEDFAPLFDVPGIEWYSLQYGPRGEDVKPFTNVYAPPIKTFADTAWWLNELDLLITVDTAAAHLAGAMGRPVWTLLPASPDWRWMLEREDTPWYPTMRLYRQQEKGQWGPVVERVRRELCNLSEQRFP